MTLVCVVFLASRLTLVSASTTTAYPPPEVDFPTQEALLKAAFEAIKHLHAQMDDDQSGSVDLTESRGFIMEELSQVRPIFGRVNRPR